MEICKISTGTEFQRNGEFIKKEKRYALMVDDDVVSESEWDLVLVLENLKCELNGIETLSCKYRVLEL